MTDLSTIESRLYIGGDLVPSSGGRAYANIDPATETPIGTAADADLTDATAAVAAARQAFDTSRWPHDAQFRRLCLLQLQDGLRRAAERLRWLIVAESGTPIALTHGVQLDLPIEDIAYWAELAVSYPYETPLPDLAAFGTLNHRLLRREPVGVVAAITPWNFPFYLNMSKVSPALAAGCTVVLKAAPDTPWSAAELGRIVAEETNMPPGVFNVLTSSDHAVGAALVESGDVDLVTFTGSTETGRKIMSAGSTTIKRLVLELGGKSAAVVLDDADLPAAVGACARAVTVHAGQSCSLATRLLVPRSRLAQATETARQAMASSRIGDPRDPKVRQGPLISATQRDRVLEMIAKAQATSQLVLGGGIPEALPRGYFVEPTLFTDVDPHDALAQEEIFGPVLAVIGFDDDADAVRIANNSRYGLGGTVWSADEDRAMAVARGMRTGTVAVNGAVWLAPDTPVGGYKQSGLGREHGITGFESFLENKSIGLPARVPLAATSDGE